MTPDEKALAKLQICSVEEIQPLVATCIIRCVGGIVRPGQKFDVGASVDSPCEGFRVSLDLIERYGYRVDFIDPPNNARVHFKGDGVSLLARGITISSVNRSNRQA